MIKLDFLFRILSYILHPFSWHFINTVGTTYVPILVLDNIHDFLNYVGNIFVLQISLTVKETV